jgi:hypothetical protein
VCSEQYDGGDAYAEADQFQKLAARIMTVQKWLQEKGGTAHPLRAFHAKIRLGVTRATFVIDPDLRPEHRVGFFQPGAEYPATVRISNASGSIQPDAQRDMRGIAIRIKVSGTEYHDFLLTNGPVSHARDAKEFVAFAEALAGSPLRLPLRLLFNLGPFTTIRMFRNLLRYATANIDTLAAETFWSRAALQWGPNLCGRLILKPTLVISPPRTEEEKKKNALRKQNPDYLRTDLATRLRAGPIEFHLHFQPFVDESRTPIENASKEWLESVSAPVPVARLVIPQTDIDSVEGQAVEEQVDRLGFNPWHTTDDFRPLGRINRARKVVYLASSAHRIEERFLTDEPLRNKIFGGLARFGFRILNVFIPWHRLGPQLGSLNLLGFRYVLRRQNLIDTEERDAPPTVMPVPATIPEALRAERSDDGSFNDLSVPRMGAEPDPPFGTPPAPGQSPIPGARFGRNAPFDAVRAALHRVATVPQPNPADVSEALLARQVFLPAKSLNLLAAAWIQFQVHDWVNHARIPLSPRAPDAKPIRVDLPGGRTWQTTLNSPPTPYMEIAENVPCPTRDPRLEGVPVFENQSSPWWDAGQLYGDGPAAERRLREPDGRGGLRAEFRLEDGFLPRSTIYPELEDTGFNENWWLGLSLMHTLFVREHNTVVGELRRAYPTWGEEELFRTARLVIAALIAKIHTVEWTPAILATETIDMALKGNWYGAPKDWLSQLGVWLVEAHALKGIPETLPDHQVAPYSLTEEFVSVYRLHPLIPDDYLFRDSKTGNSFTVNVPKHEGGTEHTATPTFWQIQGAHTLGVMRQLGLTNAVYSFGTSHPGAITLHNYPNGLRNFTRRNGERLDLSVVDLVRERARGIPRYNEFRRLLHKPKVRDFSEITSNAEWAEQMRAVYKGDVENIDTMIGLLAENPPEGFGFSDTAFRIFILMASRRLQSDRFFTVDYRPEIYSPLGLDWVARSGMKEVLERHCPELGALMPRTASAFAPWRPVGEN